MTDSGSQWSQSFGSAGVDAMRVYDEILARLFTPWARDLVDRVAPTPGCEALDIACGPGTVSFVLAKRIGSGGHVVGTDISPAMLEVARSRLALDSAAPIEWVQSPAAPLPLPDASADVLTCQQGLQFFPDKVAALAEMRRTLRSGGVAGVSVWTAIEDQPFLTGLRDAVASTMSESVADRYLGPFSLAGADAAELAEKAGFKEVSLERVTLPAVVEGGAEALVRTLVASGIATDFAALDDEGRASLLDQVSRNVAPFERNGTLHSTMTASVLRLS
ncbi:MAG: methyltransferase domain-containing protein [Actinomycetota bacterium]